MSDGIQSLSDFLGAVEAIPDRFRNRATSGAAEKHKLALETKNYLLNQYKGVEVVRSFRDPSGSVFDCVTFESQPSMQGVKDTTVPVAPDLPSAGSYESAPSVMQTSSSKVPSGTVAMRRITFEDIMRVGGKEEYFGKKYYDAVAPDGLDHYYAVGEQSVDNYGSHGKFAVYRNEINYEKNQSSSLVQSWTTFRDANTAQTVELIMKCDKLRLNSADPVLCVASTNDNYKPGTFVRNFDAPAFIQTSGRWILGAPVLPLSVKGGDQYYLAMSTKLSDGKWWVYMGGETSEDAVGYYPQNWFSDKYADGIVKKATRVQYGGESVCNPTTPFSLPSLGSGVLGAASWKNSAYVRDCRYYTTSGGTANTTLVTSASTARNFNAVRARYKSPWNETLWYGGPGVP